MSTRFTLHAYLTEQAQQGWQLLAEENGVSVTGLLESLGIALMDEIKDAGNATAVRQDWIKQGRRVDADRRRRSKV